jgi:hypothetical protein
MTFAYTHDTRLPLGGGQFLVAGTYTNSGGSDNTGGAITSRLSAITAMGSSCGASQALTVNKLTASAGTITILTVAGEDGTWWAVGRL